MKYPIIISLLLSVATAEDQTDGFVIEPSAKALKYRPCSRPYVENIQGLWKVGAGELFEIDPKLDSLLETTPKTGVKGTGLKTEDYQLQFLGLNVGKDSLIYINAFRRPSKMEAEAHLPDLKKEMVNLCDGGSSSWGAVWNKKSHQFIRFDVNGDKSLGSKKNE